MGRKAKAGEAKAAAGNPGKRPLGQENAAKLKAAGLEPPRGMSPGARKIWNALTPELVKINFLKTTDIFAMQRYCTYMAEWIECERRLRSEDEGLVYETESRHGNMRRINPLFLVRDRLEGKLERLEVGFGLTTRDRQSLMQQMAALPRGDLLPKQEQEEQPADPDGAPVQPALIDEGPLGVLNKTRH